MKKQIFVLLACLISAHSFAYLPVSGPLNLGDSTTDSGFVTERGVIIKSLQQSTCLTSCLNDLMAFDEAESINKLSSYQKIMQDLSTSTKDPFIIDAAIVAIENAIMHAFDQEVYLIGGYTPYLSVLMSGVRWRWINPFSYLNVFSWVSENNPKATQLIYELDQLSKIASRHSNTVTAHRLSATVFSYSHWKKAIMVSIACTVFTGFIAINKNSNSRALDNDFRGWNRY